MKTKLILVPLFSIFLMFCGNNNSVNAVTKTDQKIEIQLDSRGGIYALFYDGVNIFGGTNGYKGAYYVIGSCNEADDENNVNSQSFRFGQLLKVGDEVQIANRLKSPTDLCEGADYEFIFSRPEENKIKAYIGISALPETYASLSIPMDLNKNIFNKFRFGDTKSYVTNYEGGGCREYKKVFGDSGYFDEIFPSCSIPGGGATGVAKTEYPEYNTPSTWVEACSDELGICVRRVIVEMSSHKGTYINNHYGTNNVEFSWGNFLPPGTSSYIKEEITIYEF